MHFSFFMGERGGGTFLKVGTLTRADLAKRIINPIVEKKDQKYQFKLFLETPDGLIRSKLGQPFHYANSGNFYKF